MATPITALQYNTVQSKINKILGEGTGDYGYGQPVLSNPISEGDVFTFEMFDSLRTDILSARQHQTGRMITPPISAAPANGLITAAQFIQYTSTSGLVESNRLITPPSSQAVREILTSTTLIDPWNNVTTHTIQVMFDSGTAMRAYFNTGSTIEFLAARAGGSTTTKNSSWTNMLSAVGVVSFKRSATTSTKSAGTANGYAALMKQPDIPLKIFQRTVADSFKSNYYSITAQLTESNGNESPAGITFTIEFSDNSTIGLDINVTGTLTSTVRVYRAMGVFTTPDTSLVSFEALAPTITIDDLQGGAALPTYTISRAGATQIHEGDNVPVTFVVQTTNVDDNTTLYWTVNGYGITASDFEDTDSITDVSFTINSNVSEPIAFYAAADMSTEKLERFNFEVRTNPGVTSPVVANIAASLQQISDDSKNAPAISALATYRFVSQTITSVTEGFNATFTIAATGITKAVEVTWKAVGILGLVESADFASPNNKMSGTFNITSTYTLNLLTIKDLLVESNDAFQIELYVMENNVLTLKDTSATMTIVDTTVVIPEGEWLVSSNRVPSIAEGNPLGVQFTITTPTSIKNNTKLYWKAVLTSADGNLVDADFKNTGGIGIGGTNSSYIFVNNKTATLTRYAANDAFTEGTESFAIEFYTDTSPATNAPFTSDRFVVVSPVVDITETSAYTISNPLTISEGNTTGATYTVTTPYMEKGSLWWFIPITPTITADDFNAMYGEISIINSTGTFTIYAKDDALIEGNETFQVVIRATSVVTDPILKSSLSATLSETAVYTIDTQGVASIAEGGTRVDFAITTPKPAPAYLYWTLVSGTGVVVDKDDFAEGKVSGQIPISNGAGSFYLTALIDGKTEGIESFHVVLRTGAITGPIVKVGDPITITEVVNYSIAAVTTSITEGVSGTTFNITTPKVADNTIIKWEAIAVTGVIETTDFIVTDFAQQATQAKSGTVRVTNNRASFIMNARSDSTTEGAESFHVALYDADGNDLNTRSQTITLNEIVNFSIQTPVVNNSSVTSFNEGTNVVLQVYTPKRDKGTPLYWKAVRYSGTITLDALAGATPPNDFDGAWNGTVYIDDANHAEIVVGLSNDLYSDGVDVFRIEVREVSTSVLPNAVTLPLTINDTSVTPAVIIPDAPKVITITPKVSNVTSTSVYEGGTVTFVVATANILPARNIYYSIYGGAGLADNDIIGGLSSSVPLHVNLSGIVNIPVTINTDVLVEANELFMIQIILDDPINTPIGVSQAVTIIDAVQYKVAPTKTSVLEGESITFNFYTPPEARNTSIRWNIDSVSVGGSSAVTINDFDVTSESGQLYGAVAINGDGFGSVTLTAVSTDATEGAEFFTVSLSTTLGTPITLGVPCPQIRIRENIDYSLAVLSTPMDEGNNVRTFTLTTPKMANSTFTYEVNQVSGTITYSDFEETKNLTSGPIGNSFATTDNIGTFSLQARSDNNVEGNRDSFTVSIFKNGVPVAIKPDCPTIFIHETGAYNIAVDTGYSQTLIPGGLVKYHITTPYCDPNTKLYWEIIPYQSSSIAVGDFVETKSANALTGFVTINDNEGWLTLQAVPTFSKGNTPFLIQLRTVSTTGSVQPLGSPCPPVTITPAQIYSIATNGNNFVEGQTVTFTITTPVLTAGTLVYWKLVGETGSTLLAADFRYSMNGASSLPIGSTLSNNFTVGSTPGPLLLAITFVDDTTPEAAKSFHLEVSLTSGGSLVELNGLNPVVTYADEAGYVVQCSPLTIQQGGIVNYKVTVPASSTITALYWAINTSSTVLATYFSAVSGVVTVAAHPNSTIDITIPITVAALLPPAANNVSFSISLRANTINGATIPTPTMPSVVLSKGLVLSGTANLSAGGSGFTASVQAPIGTTTITWTVASSNITDTELSTGSKTGNVVPDLVTGIATLPEIKVLARSETTAATATTKSFILSVESGAYQTSSTNITVTYPAVIVGKPNVPVKTVVFDSPSLVMLGETKTVTMGVTVTNFTDPTITLELWSVATTSSNTKATLRSNFTQTIAVPAATDPVLLIGKITVAIANNKGTVTLTGASNFNRIGASKFVIKTGSDIPVLAASETITIQPTAGVSTAAADEITTPPVDNNKITNLTLNSAPVQIVQGNIGTLLFSIAPAIAADVTWAVTSSTTGNVLKFISDSSGSTVNVTSGTVKTTTTNAVVGRASGSILLAIINDGKTLVSGSFSIKLTAGTETMTTDPIQVVALKPAKTATVFTGVPGEYPIPAGVTSLNIEMKGEGGTGGSGKAGGPGLPGDAISGVIDVPTGVTTVLVKTIIGGAGSDNATLYPGGGGLGGKGGNAMSIYWKGVPTLGKELPIAIVAGGGGGAGTGGNTGVQVGSGTSLVASSTTVAGKTSKLGHGGGGAPAGSANTTFALLTGHSGGGGGASFIAATATKLTRTAGGGSAGGSNKTSTYIPVYVAVSGEAGVSAYVSIDPVAPVLVPVSSTGYFYTSGGYDFFIAPSNLDSAVTAYLTDNALGFVSTLSSDNNYTSRHYITLAQTPTVEWYLPSKLAATAMYNKKSTFPPGFNEFTTLPYLIADYGQNLSSQVINIATGKITTSSIAWNAKINTSKISVRLVRRQPAVTIAPPATTVSNTTKWIRGAAGVFYCYDNATPIRGTWEQTVDPVNGTEVQTMLQLLS